MQVRISRDVDRVHFYAALWADVQPIGQISRCVGNQRAMANSVVARSELRMNTDVVERGFDDVWLDAHVAEHGRTGVVDVVAVRTGRTAVLHEVPGRAVQIPTRVDDITIIDTNEQQRNEALPSAPTCEDTRLPVSKIARHAPGHVSSQAATIAAPGDPHLASVRL